MKSKGIQIIEKDNKLLLYLYGHIRKRNMWDSEEDIDFISADGVASALESAKSKSVVIHINSLGGDVFESIAIANMLKEHGDIEIIIDAVAGSGASIITMSGKTIKMFDNSMIMVHPASSYAAGNAKTLRKVADDLKKIDSAVLETYKTKFKGTEEELKSIIEAETWLTAKECLAFGFCDYILTDEPETKNTPQKQVQNLFEKLRRKDLELERTIANDIANNDRKTNQIDKSTNLFGRFA